MSDATLHVLMLAAENTARLRYENAIKTALAADIKYAHDTDMALAMLMSNQPPDMLVIDLEFASLSSNRLLERIKGDYRLKYTPVVILTGAGDTGQQLHQLDQGADDFIDKSAPTEVMIARLKTQWRHKLAIDRLERAALERDLFAAGVLQDIGGIKWTIVSLCRQAKDKLQHDASGNQAAIQDCLNKLTDYGSKVGRYAHDIIQSVRETQRPPRIETQNIRDHVEWVTDILASGDDAGALRIAWELSPQLAPVLGDRNYLKLALLNIAQHILDDASNHRRYLVRITQTSVEGNGHQRSQVRTELEVANKNTPAAELTTLFQPYGRGFADANADLGLSLVARVMAKMNGRAWARTSQNGSGVVYVLELPSG